jgi:hypothetical protein
MKRLNSLFPSAPKHTIRAVKLDPAIWSAARTTNASVRVKKYDQHMY